MRVWKYQDSRAKEKLGDKAPWSVGWYSPSGPRRSKKIGAKSTAEKFRKRKEAELALGLCEDRKRTRWKEFRAQFEADVLPTKDSNTRNIYKLSFNKFEKAVSPGYVDSVRTATIDKFVRVRLAEKRTPSPATINKELRHLKAAFKKAVSWEMLPKMPDVAMLREPERDPYFIDDDTFKALYAACDDLKRPAGRSYPAAEWWQALLCFAYMTGWRIGEILDLRRDDLDLEGGIAIVDAESTKGKREARIELHPVVIEHLHRITEFTPLVFDWPHHERTLWTDFSSLKEAAEVEFPGAFHRLRFGFANANVDSLDADLLQQLMRHRDPQTTRKYINVVQRMRRAGTAERLHVPDVLKIAAG